MGYAQFAATDDLIGALEVPHPLYLIMLYDCLKGSQLVNMVYVKQWDIWIYTLEAPYFDGTPVTPTQIHLRTTSSADGVIDSWFEESNYIPQWGNGYIPTDTPESTPNTN